MTLGAISKNPVYDLGLSYHKTAALIAAAKLDIFTLIADRALSDNEIASRCGASRKGVRILCDFLVILGLLQKTDGHYFNVHEYRRYFDRSLNSSDLDALDFLAAPEMIALMFADPVKYVMHGGSEGLANVAPDNPIWPKFARAMVSFATVTAKMAASKIKILSPRVKKVLDIAAGHGCYGIELAKVFPEAVVVAVDWAEVLSVAMDNAIFAGVDERYQALAGSAFEVEFGTGYDIILLPNILHHFGYKTCCKLLNKVSKSLADSGSAYIIDLVPGEDRLSPSEAGAFAYWMLATTPDGDAYTLEEYRSMANEAGFHEVRALSLHPTPYTLVSLYR